MDSSNGVAPAWEEADASALIARVAGILERLGAAPEVALEVARHLVRAEQSGHASHGVLRVAQYVREVEAGLIDPAARTVVLSVRASAAVLDAQRGFGHHAAAVAVETLVPLALANGIACVTIRNCTHIGRVGEYAERLIEHGLVGLVQLGAAGPGIGSMAPFGSRTGQPFLNTNPWCTGFPSTTGAVVFDGSMSTVAEGKVHAAKKMGVPLPEGSLLTANGAPSTDPDDFYAGGNLTPLGGLVAGHKGYGLALAAALLGGLAHADGTPATLRGLAQLREPDGSPNALGGVTMIAIDPAAFAGADSAEGAYACATGRVAQSLRDEGALVPGDTERRSRQAAGSRVSLPATTLAELAALERRFAGHPATAGELRIA